MIYQNLSDIHFPAPFQFPPLDKAYYGIRGNNLLLIFRIYFFVSRFMLKLLRSCS